MYIWSRFSGRFSIENILPYSQVYFFLLLFETWEIGSPEVLFYFNVVINWREKIFWKFRLSIFTDTTVCLVCLSSSWNLNLKVLFLIFYILEQYLEKIINLKKVKIWKDEACVEIKLEEWQYWKKFTWKCVRNYSSELIALLD